MIAVYMKWSLALLIFQETHIHPKWCKSVKLLQFMSQRDCLLHSDNGCDIMTTIKLRLEERNDVSDWRKAAVICCTLTLCINFASFYCLDLQCFLVQGSFYTFQSTLLARNMVAAVCDCSYHCLEHSNRYGHIYYILHISGWLQSISMYHMHKLSLLIVLLYAPHCKITWGLWTDNELRDLGFEQSSLILFIIKGSHDRVCSLYEFSGVCDETCGCQ